MISKLGLRTGEGDLVPAQRSQVPILIVLLVPLEALGGRWVSLQCKSSWLTFIEHAIGLFRVDSWTWGKCSGRSSTWLFKLDCGRLSKMLGERFRQFFSICSFL